MNTNPWKGVVPYSSNEDLQQHPFRGRDKEIEELLFTVHYNHMATFYGQSGIGKTSLLHVGLYPRLREEGYQPIELRLSVDDIDGQSYARRIVEALTPVATPIPGLETNLTEDDNAEEYLWNFFACHTFDQTPVVVLDQFEEVLRRQPDKALILLRQLRATLQDGYLPDGSSYHVNFRLLISLREDDLYLLEDMLDSHFIDGLKQGRYRLAPMTDEAARDIIHIRHGIVTGDDQAIEDRLLSISRQDKDNQISTLVLSVACSMAYEKSADGHLTLPAVLSLGDNPLSLFYDEAMEGQPDNVRQWVEEYFVDQDRRRYELLSNIPPAYRKSIAPLMDEQNERHIFTHTSRSRQGEDAIELLHDKLALTIVANKEARHRQQAEAALTAEKEANRRRTRRLWITLSAVAAVALLLWVVSLGVKSRIPFDPDKVVDGAIPRYSRLYHVKDSTLVLRNCTVEPNTFPNNPEVRTLVLDSAFIMKNALNLPNLDTIIIRNLGHYTNSIPDSVHAIVACRPSVNLWGKAIPFRHLDTVIIHPDDSLYVKWYRGVLFGRDSVGKAWNAIANRRKKYEEYYADPNDFDAPFHGVLPLLDYDLAHPADIATLPQWFKNRVRWRLVCTDSTRTRLRRSDINTIREQIAIIDLPYIEQIEANAFANYYSDGSGRHYNSTLRRVYCPRLKSIGDSMFYRCDSLIYVEAPRALSVGTLAFNYCDSLSYLDISSAKAIARYALPWSHPKDYAYYWDSTAKTESYIGLTNSAIRQAKTAPPEPELTPDDATLGYHVELLRHGDKVVIGGDVHTFDPYQIVIDSPHVALLEIGDSIVDILNKYTKTETQIEEVRIDRNNRFFLKWHGDVYKREREINKNVFTRVLYTPNKTRFISVPRGVREDRRPARYFEYIALNRDYIDRWQSKNATLWVPYGQLDAYPAKGWFNVKELSWWKTLYYRIYNQVSWSAFIFYRTAATSWKNHYTVDLNDVMAFTTCGLFLLLLLWLSARVAKRRWRWYLDLPVLAIVLIVAGMLAFACDITHTKEVLDETKTVISMWPVWWFAPVLWVAWLWLSAKLFKRRHRQPAADPNPPSQTLA